MVTWGQKEFHNGQVEVSMMVSQISTEAASTKVEPLTWLTASEAEIVGVGLDESGVAMVIWEDEILCR